MILTRTFDAGPVNAIVNNPEVRPYIGGAVDEYLDLSIVVEQTRNVFLIGEHGTFALAWGAPHTYEAHFAVLPAGRGAWALAAAREGLETMRTEFGADRIWGRIVAAHVGLFARMVGAVKIGKMQFDLGDGLKSHQLFEWRA